jgi:hypothetical protein
LKKLGGGGLRNLGVKVFFFAIGLLMLCLIDDIISMGRSLEIFLFAVAWILDIV